MTNFVDGLDEISILFLTFESESNASKEVRNRLTVEAATSIYLAVHVIAE